MKFLVVPPTAQNKRKQKLKEEEQKYNPTS